MAKNSKQWAEVSRRLNAAYGVGITPERFWQLKQDRLIPELPRRGYQSQLTPEYLEHVHDADELRPRHGTRGVALALKVRGHDVDDELAREDIAAPLRAARDQARDSEGRLVEWSKVASEGRLSLPAHIKNTAANDPDTTSRLLLDLVEWMTENIAGNLPDENRATVAEEVESALMDAEALSVSKHDGRRTRLPHDDGSRMAGVIAAVAPEVESRVMATLEAMILNTDAQLSMLATADMGAFAKRIRTDDEGVLRIVREDPTLGPFIGPTLRHPTRGPLAAASIFLLIDANENLLREQLDISQSSRFAKDAQLARG